MKIIIFNCLIIAQIFEIKVKNIDNILNIKDELEKLLEFKNIIINKLKNEVIIEEPNILK